MSLPLSSKSATTFDVDNFIKALECPITLEPLTTAVSLFPCTHKVNAAAAKAMYGAMRSTEEGVKKRGPCPTCKKTVTAYYDDHFTRGIVAMLASPKKNEMLSLASAQIQADLKEKRAEEILPQNDLIDWEPVDFDPDTLINRLAFRCKIILLDLFWPS